MNEIVVVIDEPRRVRPTRAGKSGAIMLLWLLAPLLSGSVAAQIAPRLTGKAVIEQLQTAQRDLSARAAALPRSDLAATSQRLGDLAVSLGKILGNDVDKPLDIIDAQARGSAYRASAAAQRAEAYLAAASGCQYGDAQAMADALATTVKQLAHATDASKAQPVVNAVETLDHRPLFVLRNGSKGAAFALVGANLFDAQCADPSVTATDAQGRLQAVQPVVTGVLPTRIELKLPDATGLDAGSYVLHVVSKRKAFLVGCSAQPEAVAALQVAAPARMSVSYGVTATCRMDEGGRAVDRALAPVRGTLPEMPGSGTVSQSIAIGDCPDPVSYAITATVSFGDGQPTTVGPISQSASAGITAGLPGGLSLSWDPSVRQLFVRAAANRCKGVY